MAISSFTGNLTDTVAKINEVSALNGWNITSIASGNDLLLNDNNGNTFMRLTGVATGSDLDNHGINCYYNNGNSNIGYVRRYGSGTLTVTLHITSHGFFIKNNSARELSIGYVNINDDGTIIYGSNGSSSDATSTLYTNFQGIKYSETTYQNLGFTSHTNAAGTTLCNVTAVGSLGEPQIAKYMFYAPVYQSAITGEVSIDDERYVAYGGMWYLKD